MVVRNKIKSDAAAAGRWSGLKLCESAIAFKANDDACDYSGLQVCSVCFSGNSTSAIVVSYQQFNRFKTAVI